MALTQISTKGIKDGTITGADLATNVDLVDNQKIRFGTGNDLEIFHDGTDSILKDTRNSGNFRIQADSIGFNDKDVTETMLLATADGSVDLYFNGSKKFETKSDGVLVTGELQATTLDINGNGHIDGTLQLTNDLFLGDNDEINVGSSNDLKIYHDGSNSYLKNAGTGNIIFLSDDVQFKSDGGGNTGLTIDTDAGVELYYNNSKKFETTSDGALVSGHLNFPDASVSTGRIRMGAGDDLMLYHDGSNSYVIDSGTGNFYIGTDDFNVTNAAVTESFIKAVENGQVELYYNNSKKFETTNLGAQVTGRLNVSGNFEQDDNVKANWGNSHDLQIYHDGSDSFIKNSTGTLKIQTQVNIDSTDGSEHMARFIPNGTVELYHNGNKKLETTSSGITVQGTVTETSDIALKSDIQPITNSLEKIQQITGYKYTLDSSISKSMGVIAQDVEKVFPELVHGSEGNKTLQYSGLIGVLIEAVKDLSTQVAALKAG